MFGKVVEKFEGKGFWAIFGIVLGVFALAGMAVSFLFGLLTTFIRYAYYSAIFAFIVALAIYYKKGGRR